MSRRPGRTSRSSLKRHPNEPVLGVMDNLSAHSADDMSGRFPPGGHTLCSCRRTRRSLTLAKSASGLARHRLARLLPLGQKAQAKRQVLLNCLEEVKGVVTAERCAAWWAHSKTFYPACLAGLPWGPPSKFSFPAPVPLPPLPPEFPELPLLPPEVLGMLPVPPLYPYFDGSSI